MATRHAGGWTDVGDHRGEESICQFNQAYSVTIFDCIENWRTCRFWGENLKGTDLNTFAQKAMQIRTLEILQKITFEENV